MGRDNVREQIGLAMSEDGTRFVRSGKNGLIIPANRDKPWKALRTCNPTVIQEPNRFLMFYQGIANNQKASIGVATSLDGISWGDDDDPAMTVESESKALQTNFYGTTHLIEPTVIRENGGYRMWLVTKGKNELGNRVHHATSNTGLSWTVDRANLLSGSLFGDDCQVHYPQVVPTQGGYWFYVSVRRKHRFSVWRAFSVDGFSFGKWSTLVHADVMPNKMYRILNKLSMSECFFSHGLAHSHIVDNDQFERTYFHAYHLNRNRRLYMNIVSVEASDPDRVVTVFETASEVTSWDYNFVADPFVIRFNEQAAQTKNC
jgi:hypothetical protein